MLLPRWLEKRSIAEKELQEAFPNVTFKVEKIVFFYQYLYIYIIKFPNITLKVHLVMYFSESAHKIKNDTLIYL